ncbi:hypothetical protein ACIQBJ_04700 [Kitasatospora sp. NPDC088391]|uniref:hypothetical protein n=1 Tax=Kitasatospora sp. NPDC088391 TaxID=3364074 RepID=UPI0038015A36
MRPLRLAAVTAACLSTVALLTACDPEGGSPAGGGTSAAAPPPAASSPAAGASGTAGASSPARGTGPGRVASGGTSKLPTGVWLPAAALPLDAQLGWAVGQPRGGGPQDRFMIEDMCRAKRDAAWADTVPGVDSVELNGGGAKGWSGSESIVSFGSAAKSSAAKQSSFGLLNALKDEVKGCASTAPGATVKIVADGSETLAAVVTLPSGKSATGAVEVHEYLTTSGGAVVELNVWTDAPRGGAPKVPWGGQDDAALLAALGRPVCTALKDC